MPNLILITGPSGVGKTTLTLALAHRLNATIADSDAYLSLHWGTAAQIAKTRGKGYLHAAERLFTKRTTLTPGVKALPYSAIDFPPLRRHLASIDAYILYLYADPKVLFERTRVREESIHQLRPGTEDMSAITHLHNRRHPLYKSLATLSLDTSAMSTTQVTEKVLFTLD